MADEALKQLYSEQHLKLMRFFQSLEAADWRYQKEGAWAPIQHLDHLIKFVEAVNTALRKPRFLLRRAFGKPNRPLRSYEEVVARYQERSAGKKAVAPEDYTAGKIDELKEAELLLRFSRAQEKLITNLDRFSSKKLEGCLLPHPLMGRMIVKEMLYFMHYHADHHYARMLADLPLKEDPRKEYLR